MKNYHNAIAILNLLNTEHFDLKEHSQLENMEIRMIKPPRRRQPRSLLQRTRKFAAEEIQKSSGSIKIRAIKFVREIDGCSLKDAKDWVEKNMTDKELNRGEYSGDPLTF